MLHTFVRIVFGACIVVVATNENGSGMVLLYNDSIRACVTNRLRFETIRFSCLMCISVCI